MESPDDEKSYSGFMVNRGLSYFADTAVLANMMNSRWHLGPKEQYEFLLHSVPKRRRFSKWFKGKKLQDLQVIQDYFGYSITKAREALDVLTDDQVDCIRKKMQKGGR